MKKTLAAITLGIVIIGGTALWIEFRDREESVIGSNAKLEANADISSQLAKALTEKDGDSDGLLDWEENLWGTDPKNPDTDKDKTGDSEEIKQGRDPKKPGPNDKVEQGKSGRLSAFNDIAKKDALPETQTGEFAKKFFLKYMALKQSGQPINEFSMRALIDDSIDDSSTALSYRIYKLADLKTIKNDSPASIRAYANMLGEALIRYSPKQMEPEILIFIRAGERDDQDELKKLDPIIAGYKQFLSYATKTIVPNQAEEAHLSLLNGLSKLTATIEGMRYFYEDPIKGIASVETYNQAEKELSWSLNLFSELFKKNGIVFSPAEGGGALTSALKMETKQ